MSTPQVSLPLIYEHRKLSEPRAVRLIRLLATSQRDSDVHCEFTEAQPNSTFEALSWCWGTGEAAKLNKILWIRVDGKVSPFPISRSLEAALKALRNEESDRHLWVDAICINQADLEEKSQQVPNMNQIYGKAKNVCKWLGEEEDESTAALEFIKKEVLKLWEFDDLCTNLNKAEMWHALITLMKRPWFSRRWVVQEIALARHGTLHCGTQTLDWQEFADAVSLFVEVESATHRLSDVMKQSKKYGHIPSFFGDVPALGAALLVDATSNLFRNTKDNGSREPLFSLEYLVSSLSVFEASNPHDIIYALLAIAKDTTPQSTQPEQLPGMKPEVQQRLVEWASQYFSQKVYHVDYSLDVVDVYKQFIVFSTSQSEKWRALDIICRPWAPPIPKNVGQTLSRPKPTEFTTSKNDPQDGSHTEPETVITMPSWIPDLDNAAFIMKDHPQAGRRMERKNADPLVGMPSSSHRNYSAAGTVSLQLEDIRYRKRSDHHSMFVQGFIYDEVGSLADYSQLGNIPSTWLTFGGWNDIDKDPPDDFWRTLVADRGPNGRNPPTFYPRACKESMKKGLPGGSNSHDTLDTKVLINEGQCTIVAEFLRRVQAVIWNKRLMYTKDNYYLGLLHKDAKQGDLVCILYGCSVPVILRETAKAKQEVAREQFQEDRELQEKFEVAMKRVQSAFRERRKAKEAERLRELDEELTFLKRITRWQRQPRFQKLQKRPTWQKVPAWQKLSTWQKLIIQLQEYLIYMRLFWLCGVGFYVKFWSNLTTQNALIADTVVFLLSGLAWSMQPNPLSKTRSLQTGLWAFLKFARFIWPILVVIHAGFWQTLSLKEAFVAVTSLLLFPDTLTEIRSMATALWDNRPLGSFSLEDLKADTVEDKYYTVIGECYVHGIMNGEAIAYQNSKSIKMQTFELR